MAKGGGLALKGFSWFLRGIEFCCAVIILGIFSYFLAELARHNLHVATYIRAVEGISGAAVVYTIFALLLVCCLGGVAIFAFLGMLLDLAFTGAFIYLAYATRHGANSCSGFVRTPFGNGYARNGVAIIGPDGNRSTLPSLRTACKLQTATFAVAIVGAVFFFLSIFVEFALMRHRKKEKALRPAHNNGYTAGQPRRKFWQRKPKNTTYVEKNGDVLPHHATPADTRTSYATDATAVGGTGVHEPPYNKYGNHAGGVPVVGHGAGHPVAGSVAPNQGYSTTTTTHVGHDGHVHTHQPYNANPTATAY